LNVAIAGRELEFRPWKPEMGAVFYSTYSFDCETTLIDEEHPWLVPAYVLGAGCDGRRGVFVLREHVEAFFRTHAGVPFVLHHAPFDLAVIITLAPGLGIYDWVDKDHV
jgi:hypothetical protein